MAGLAVLKHTYDLSDEVLLRAVAGEPLLSAVLRRGVLPSHAAPRRVARDRLSCSSAVSFSSPIRWRQRVIDERSNGNAQAP
jgi:hypothetical protein